MNKVGEWRPKDGRGPACGYLEGTETRGYVTLDLPSNPNAPHVTNG